MKGLFVDDDAFDVVVDDVNAKEELGGSQQIQAQTRKRSRNVILLVRVVVVAMAEQTCMDLCGSQQVQTSNCSWHFRVFYN
jgi:hypothetical protein